MLKLAGAGTDAFSVVSPKVPRCACSGLVALAVLSAACSSSSAPAGRGISPHDPGVRVKVRDFKVVAPRVIASGTVALRVHNTGPDTHELLLVRTDSAPLPLRADDLTVDEDAVASRTIGTLEDDHPNTDRIWTVKLAPGTYEIFCNMSGHYLGGMHTRLVVR